MDKREQILQILDRMPMTLLKTISQFGTSEPVSIHTKSLSELAIALASGSDRVLVGHLAGIVDGDVQAMAFTAGAGAALCHERQGRQPAQLVLSGPEVDTSSARETAAVISQLITGAQRECLLMTYVFSHADIPLSLLTSAARSGVKITCIFDPATLMPNDSATEETLKELLELQADVLCWENRHHTEASMHAKAVVADNERCLITSANLTARAMTHNLELGVLLPDPSLCIEITQHCERMRKRGWVRPYIKRL